MNEQAEYRQALASRGVDTRPVDALVDAIVFAKETSALPGLLAQLDAESDRVPWHWDCDYAAVALHEQAARAASAETRIAMLNLALKRAGWCAGCATSGAEGIARSQHVHELAVLLEQTR